MSTLVRIAIAEPSVIIRNGILSVLKRISLLNIHIVEVVDMSQLSNQLLRERADMLIVNPSFLGVFSLQEIKNHTNKALKCIALQYGVVDKSLLNIYDETISVYDTADEIRDKIVKLSEYTTEPENAQEQLTQREKEIVICVVKGMTNKQIADALFLSTHTVITHRRNIAAKLQIHSPSGLTIYAIVNKLVELNDIKNSINSEDS